MLSNILSRNSDNEFLGSLCRSAARDGNKRINLWQGCDQKTLLSCDNNSNFSVKIEESQVEDIGPRNNFAVLKEQSIGCCNYTVNLAIELNVLCLVSLKKIDFREMGVISQELQIYEFVEQSLGGCEVYRSILQLYQVQMSNGSYILIKEPFTRSLMK
jgi:hypothetical protein